jgi:hypothetical protein
MPIRKPDWRRTRLLADGRKALEMRRAGRSPADMLMVLGCSRARLYRAMDAAERAEPMAAARAPAPQIDPSDPLLL